MVGAPAADCVPRLGIGPEFNAHFASDLAGHCAQSGVVDGEGSQNSERKKRPQLIEVYVRGHLRYGNGGMFHKVVGAEQSLLLAGKGAEQKRAFQRAMLLLEVVGELDEQRHIGGVIERSRCTSLSPPDRRAITVAVQMRSDDDVFVLKRRSPFQAAWRVHWANYTSVDVMIAGGRGDGRGCRTKTGPAGGHRRREWRQNPGQCLRGDSTGRRRSGASLRRGLPGGSICCGRSVNRDGAGIGRGPTRRLDGEIGVVNVNNAARVAGASVFYSFGARSGGPGVECRSRPRSCHRLLSWLPGRKYPRKVRGASQCLAAGPREH